MALTDSRELARLRLADPNQYRLPRDFNLEFVSPQTDDEHANKDLIDRYRKSRQTLGGRLHAQL